jgi:ring-1,2-phenylacetyl-CoA epoxidase subunit PaaE
MNAIPRTRFHDLRVLDVVRETSDAVCLTLAPPPEAEALFHFTPGQYLTLRHVVDGVEHRRSYSICSAPGDGALRVGVKRVEGGLVSAWIVDSLKPGDTVEAMPPEGRFGFAPDPAAPPRTVLLVAAGSGITPILSIAAATLAAEPRSRVVLLYGNRAAADIMFRTALEDLKDRHLTRLSVVHVLSREKHELAALHGRLDADRLRALIPGLVPPGVIDAAYLCGPAGLAAAATEALSALGLPPDRIHVEHFSPSRDGAPPRRKAAHPASSPPVATAAITLDGVTRDVALFPDETVLEAGLRAGMDLPWSCRGGMCCTCRARVTEGAVEMATNYSLQPWEIEGGYVLTCQSRPTTPRLALDYDAA